MRTTVSPRAAYRRASACTLVTSGQVASMTRRPRCGRLRRAPRRDAVRGENDRAAPAGTSSSSSTKTAPRRSRSADDVGVVHDLPAHVDRGAVPVQRPLDDLDRPLDAGAERPRRGEQHLAGASGGRRPVLQRRARRGAAYGSAARPPSAVSRAAAAGGAGVSTMARTDRERAAPAAAARQRPDSMSTASAPVCGQRPALGARCTTRSAGERSARGARSARRGAAPRRAAAPTGTADTGRPAADLVGDDDVARAARPVASAAADARPRPAAVVRRRPAAMRAARLGPHARCAARHAGAAGRAGRPARSTRQRRRRSARRHRDLPSRLRSAGSGPSAVTGKTSR